MLRSIQLHKYAITKHKTHGVSQMSNVLPSEAINSLKIDYHLSYYRTSCHLLTQGIADPKELARQFAIRDAALCALALEIGLIQEVGNCQLPRPIWEKVIDFIHRYEKADQELELAQEFPTLAQLAQLAK